MGRLTLNIVVSFAQFERESIADRTRDKMGAARKRGRCWVWLWGSARAPCSATSATASACAWWSCPMGNQARPA